MKRKAIRKAQGSVVKIYSKFSDDFKGLNYKFAYISYHIDNKSITSTNMISISRYYHIGSKINIWYLETNPQKVYRYKFTAFLFGK